VKLVHAADIHLDSPMRGLAAYDGAPERELRGATREALRNLVDLCIGERADALLIAGDLYDGDWQDYGTGAFFAREAARLREAGIPVVLIRGNHDAASRITRSLRLPDNVRELPVDRPGTVAFDDLGLAVHGQGYAKREVLEDLSAGYPRPVPGMVNVGLLHTSADGREGHAPYAPCKVGRLAEHGYDYWALGHVHQRELLHADPPILFSGCLQGRHARETGPKGATIVSFNGRRPTLEERALDVVRWEVLEIDAGPLGDLDEVLDAIERSLRDAVEGADGRLLAARIRVTGATTAHGALGATCHLPRCGHGPCVPVVGDDAGRTARRRHPARWRPPGRRGDRRGGARRHGRGHPPRRRRARRRRRRQGRVPPRQVLRRRPHHARPA